MLFAKHIKERHPSQEPKLFAVGHSLGGTSLLQAQTIQPNLFEHLVCHEPIILHFYGENNPNEPESHSLSVGAAKRRATFSSRDEVKSAYLGRKSSPFKLWTPKCFDLYLKYGFKDLPSGEVTLKCTPAVESAIFMQGSTGMWELSHTVDGAKVLLVYGARTTHYPPPLQIQLKRRFTSASVRTLRCSSFPPLLESHCYCDVTSI
jgi:pimeloyl-ACP methyl ester carboxylesterase